MILKYLLKNKFFTILLTIIHFSINKCMAINEINCIKISNDLDNSLQNLNNCLQNNIYNTNNTFKKLHDSATSFFKDITLVQDSKLNIHEVINKHIKLILYLNDINDSLIPNNIYENISEESDKCNIIELLSNTRYNVQMVVYYFLNREYNKSK